MITQTSLADFYEIYARNSTNKILLEKKGGSVVEVGTVRRFGFFLTGEYALSDRVTAQLSLGYFYTQHLNVGPNLALFEPDTHPNTQSGLQDLTGLIKFLAYQHPGTVAFGVAPYLGFAFPVQKYDTSVNNPIGDGVLSLDLGLALSVALPKAGLFFNGDAVYRVRERKNFGGNLIYDQVQLMFEAGYFILPSLSIRAMVRYYESLGGRTLSFVTDPGQGTQTSMQLFQNPLVYDQDGLFVGGGPYLQVSDSFGIGLNYVQAVWFRNLANVKTVVLSLSYSPAFSRTPPPEEPYPLPADEMQPEPATGLAPAPPAH